MVVGDQKKLLVLEEMLMKVLLLCVQGTLPLKELTICNLQQNCNHSQPQEHAFQINGAFVFTKRESEWEFGAERWYFLIISYSLLDLQIVANESITKLFFFFLNGSFIH